MNKVIFGLLYAWCGIVFAFAQERQCADPLWMKLGKDLVWPVLLEGVVLGERASICDEPRPTASQASPR